MTDLHTRLTAAVNARLEVARAAAAAKPGEWRVVATHVGGAYDGFSRVLAEEQTATGRITRFVAHNIFDSLNVQGSSLNDEPPRTAIVADHIALNDPATVIRHCERDLKMLQRHAPLTTPAGIACRHCDSLCHSRSGLGCESPDAPWPCPDIEDLAADITASTHQPAPKGTEHA